MNRRWMMVAMVLAGAMAAGAGDYKAKKDAAAAAATQKAAAPVPKGGYTVTSTITIGGEGASWENITVDPDGKFLYITKQRKTIVIDLATGKTAAEVIGGQGATSVALVPEVGRGFVTNKEGTVTIFDIKSNRVLGSVHVGDDPGAIVYDPSSKKVLVSCSAKMMILAPDIDPGAGKPEAGIDIPGKVDGMVADGSGMVYMTMRDRIEVEVIDTRVMKFATTWPLGDKGKPFGLSMDRQRSRLFMTCQNKFVAVSAADGHSLEDIVITPQLTGTAFADGKVFVTGGNDGMLTIFGQNADGKFEPIQSLLVGGSIHAPVANPKTGAIYVPAIDIVNHSPVKGSFKILVVEKDKGNAGAATAP